jgi:uncharacterized damage-inducible protein DinB
VNRCAYWIVALSFGGCALEAQTNPVIAEMKANYNAVKTNLIKAAEKMPDDTYGWKPVDSVRTLGALIGHIAGAQARTCGTITGKQVSVDVNKTEKADLVAALKASFDACDAAWDSMNDTSAAEMIAGRGGRQTSKLGTLAFITIVHNNEEYGYLAMYMRMKGMVPPSSDRGPM